MQWTERNQRVKAALILGALLIAGGSLLVSHILIRDLYDEEHKKMGIWAEAMRTLEDADSNADLSLVLKVIDSNTTIPVVVVDGKGNIQTWRNIETGGDSITSEKKAKRMIESSKRIRINVSQTTGDYIDVYFGDSLMLRRLAAFPYIQLAVAVVFLLLALLALLSAKRAEQNKVWVGLSKETAHQLGTPISSLMAWVEVLRETYPDDAMIPEMANDVQRLRLVADRFSKIGSLPELQQTNIYELVNNVAAYMNRRTPERVAVTALPVDSKELIANINPPLFEWVIENLCKNAVDAIGESSGSVTLRTGTSGSNRIFVEVEDTGRGIRRKDVRNVFRPGFTTKQRGWGLGLSLARRIVEEYHGGSIYVKNTELGKGTVFRIEITGCGN